MNRYRRRYPISYGLVGLLGWVCLWVVAIVAVYAAIIAGRL